MKTRKICISVDDRLYMAFQERYSHSLRQAVEELMRRSIRDDSFLWNFIHGCLFVDDLRTVVLPKNPNSVGDLQTVILS